MIRILHVLTTLNPVAGGVSEAVRNMIRYASDPEISHEVLCLDEAHEAYLNIPDCKIHALGKGFTNWNYSPGFKPWLKDHILEYQIIFVHGLWQYHSFIIHQQLGKLPGAKPKLFLMPHGMLDPYFQKAKGRFLKSIRNLIVWEMAERHLVNAADALLFTCDKEKDLAALTFRGYRPRSVQVIGLGVQDPSDRIILNRSGLHQKFPNIYNRRYFLFLGRIHPKKGLDFLIDSYARLKSVYADIPALVIAGPGLDTAFGRQIQRSAIADPDILFPGMLEGQEKWDAFFGCEAFILPSHQENFGIAVVEALACGKPVLISDQINIAGDIEMDGAGVVAEANQKGTDDLIHQWMRLNEHQKSEYISNSRISYDKRYSEAQAALVFFKIINSC